MLNNPTLSHTHVARTLTISTVSGRAGFGLFMSRFTLRAPSLRSDWSQKFVADDPHSGCNLKIFYLLPNQSVRRTHAVAHCLLIHHYLCRPSRRHASIYAHMLGCADSAALLCVVSLPRVKSKRLKRAYLGEVGGI